MQMHWRPVLFILAAALLPAGGADAQRRGVRRAARSVPNSVLAKSLPVYGFKTRGAAPAVLFVQQTEGPSMHAASAFANARGGWAVAGVPELGQYGWTMAARSPEAPRYWAIAEIDVAGPGNDLDIVSSRDGRTWGHHSLDKVSRFASYVEGSFYMTRGGRGAVTVELTPDGAQTEGTPSVRPGFYTYTTRNHGLTWSKTYSFSAARPPALAGALKLESPEAYNLSEPPGAARMREMMRELSQ